jgi:23S rRNA (guanosine2251-2'-O)-methyltransferase
MKHAQGQKQSPSIYGFHAVREAWLNPQRHIDALFVTAPSRGGFEATMQEAKKKGLKRPSPTEIDKQKFDRMLPQGAVHQGLALACAPLEDLDERDLMIKLGDKPEAVIAILDQVTDPHNVGAILRSASAFGLDGVIMQKKHAPALEGVLAKTACGAVEHIPVAQATNLSRAIEDLKQAGFFVLGMDERGPQVIGKDRFSRVAIVLGSEGEGIRRLVKESCDSLVRLPTGGAIASLNVSNAAAVAFFALKNG